MAKEEKQLEGGTSEVVNDDSKVIETLRKQIEAKDKIIEALEAEVKELKENKGAEKTVPTVKVGKKTYFVKVPRFNYKGKDYTAADVVNDQKLATELVEEQSGVLEEKKD
jgi:hypothetical protein